MGIMGANLKLNHRFLPLNTQPPPTRVAVTRLVCVSGRVAEVMAEQSTTPNKQTEVIF